jgi:hypothetical protein
MRLGAIQTVLRLGHLAVGERDVHLHEYSVETIPGRVRSRSFETRTCRRPSAPPLRTQPATVAHVERKRPLPAEDALPRRHDARHVTPGILPPPPFGCSKSLPAILSTPLLHRSAGAPLPKPRVSLTPFQGCLRPTADTARVTPARRGRGDQHETRALRSRQRSNVAPRGPGRRAGNGSPGSISRPARPAAGRCESSPVLRIPTSSRGFHPQVRSRRIPAPRTSLTWIRKWLS